MTDKSDVHRRDAVKEYIDGLYSPASEDLAELRRVGEEGHIPIILKDTETLIGVILQMKKPSVLCSDGKRVIIPSGTDKPPVSDK